MSARHRELWVALALALAGAPLCAAAEQEQAPAPPTPAPMNPAPAEPAPVGAAPVETLEQALARIAALEARVAALEQIKAELERELAREHEKRLERELAWFEHNKAVAQLPLDAIASTLQFPVELDPEVRRARGELEKKIAEEAAAVPDPAADRGAELGRSINARLVAEGARWIDLLEPGRLGPDLDAPRWIGPVVFRTFDHQGRLSGSISAARLRLESSRAARTVSLVLEDGTESRDGHKLPFASGAGGAREILLPNADPERWIESCRELFPSGESSAPRDDGRWDLGRVRAALDRLLDDDAAAGIYRMRYLGGVVDGVLRDVQIVVLDASGKVQRRLFADRMSIARQEGAIVILLEGGASMRGDEKAGFLDGRFRIYLPRARPEDWEAARLPGLGEPDREPSWVPAAQPPPPGDAPAPAAPAQPSPAPNEPAPAEPAPGAPGPSQPVAR